MSEPWRWHDVPVGRQVVYKPYLRGEVVYVGMSSHLSSRLSTHKSGRGSDVPKKEFDWAKFAYVGCHEDAQLLEWFLISVLRPPLNSAKHRERRLSLRHIDAAERFGLLSRLCGELVVDGSMSLLPQFLAALAPVDVRAAFLVGLQEDLERGLDVFDLWRLSQQRGDKA